ncbi:Mu transposase C-terminal domain-containing protein [Streptomyces silvisoli]|uniref:Mu transposase C-terminal domain-containing protein n=1 Tax=Streptomyces silvisoli TaxID=3034235 RepID=A0ABT5ZRJ3_9ACTN|nr:Mu transposase C-terminal domain-containing protein [Streptomyces silvisoli]MDF3292444.1 Mu transposase C-terminal domain-containing protein [Streptomyces silvisoli]
MTVRVLSLFPGADLLLDGQAAEVVQLDGVRAVLKVSATGQFTTVSVGHLAARARPLADVPADEGGAGADAGVVLAAVPQDQLAAVRERAEHVREVLTGFRSGYRAGAAAGEPRPQFDPARSLKDRYRAKAEELGVTARTVERWAAEYQASGEAGLVDARSVRGRGTRVDPRWEEAVRWVLAQRVTASTPTRRAVLEQAARRVEEVHGPGVVPMPSQATAFRRLAEWTAGTNAVSGSAAGRRSIAARPSGTYGRLRASRPGEYVVLDTQDLDVYAMEPVTGRWLPVQLTVAQDLFSRCVLGLRLTPVSTKAVDVAGVLYQTMAPPAVQELDSALPYHGIPQHLVFTETSGGLEAGVCPPETLVVDHGRAFLSAHVIGICARLGVSVQPAQPYKPTDKPTVERFFRTLREGLIQHLPAYKGPDIYSRGERIEDQAFYFLHELEDLIREWIREVYHHAKHSGLVVPQWPTLQLSPSEMFAIGVAKAGVLRIPACSGLAYDFLQVVPRTIQHYGVEVHGLRYNGPALDPYRGSTSPYGGTLAGKWPIRVNPDDVRCVYFHDPADSSWHRLWWEHAPLLEGPFSTEAAQYARRLATGSNCEADPARGLAALLARWSQGEVADRREKRIAARIAAERVALPTLVDSAVPVAATGSADLVAGDDDRDEELFDDVDDEDFYADAFEVIE